jgi:hypothetical protein
MTTKFRKAIYAALTKPAKDFNGNLFEKYLKDRPLTVEYRSFSADKHIPTFAKALGFRSYDQEPDFYQEFKKEAGLADTPGDDTILVLQNLRMGSLERMNVTGSEDDDDE